MITSTITKKKQKLFLFTKWTTSNKIKRNKKKVFEESKQLTVVVIIQCAFFGCAKQLANDHIKRKQ